MDFYDVLDQAIDLLQRHGRVSYRALKRQFSVDDNFLADLVDELVEIQQVATDQDGRMLVWSGKKELTPQSPSELSMPESPPLPATEPESEPLSYTPPHLAEKILTSKSALEGERKQVTVLFCDLQSSTPLAEQIGPENMHALLNRFFELALSEVHRYEGTINQFLGDGFMALFGAPVSHEDHARRAILSAIGLQRALKDSNPGEAYGVECRFRMGINSGLVVVASIGDNLRMDYTAVGDATNLASRLQTQSEPGDIFVSETTARLVEGDIRLEALSPLEVKGKSEPVSAYKVIGALPRRSPIVSRSERILSQFVGRERELATLEALFAQVASGNGQVIGIVAEAGQGKSRLLYEFRQRLANQQVTYLEGRCLSYGSSIPYHPVIEIVRSHCGIAEADHPEAMIEKVNVAFREVGMDAEASAPFLLRLLGVQDGTASMSMLTPEAVRTRTFDALRQMSLQGSQKHPLIVEIEDLHWIDKTSEDYLASLVESLAGARLMLLTTYRPGYRPPWLEKSYATQISLHNLAPQDALTIVHSAHADASVPDALAKTIVAKAEGNPFFLEELTRAVIERGNFQAEVVAPDTIQGVLSARIDRLPESHKRLLQTASVLGREFSPRLLRAIWDDVDSLDALLAELKRLEFLFERPGGEEPIFVFRHALTQDVAYESLLTTRRQTLHASAGTALEALYPNGLTERTEELAYHFRLGGIWDKAFDYLTRSGDKAREAFANQEAITFYTQAIEISGRITPVLDRAQLLPIYQGRGVILRSLSSHDKAIADFQMMRQLARDSGNIYKEGESLWLLGLSHFAKSSDDQVPFMEQYAREGLQLAQQTGAQQIRVWSLISLARVHIEQINLQEAIKNLEEVVQISRRKGYKSSLAPALGFLCQLFYFQGNLQSIHPLADEGAKESRAIFDSIPELHNLSFLCQAHWSIGNYREACNIAYEISTKAQERNIPFYLSRIKNTLGWFHRELGDVTRAIEYDLESVELGQTAPVANAKISALVNLGFDYLALNQIEQSQSYLETTLERVKYERFGSHRWRWTMKLLFGLAELSYTTGDHDQALSYVDGSLKEAQRTSSQKYVALGRALRGKIIAKLGDAETAGAELQRAFTLADQLQSPSLIYPIAYDFGQWHENAGHEREASALYGKAKMTVEQMATAVEDESLRSTFLQSALVQEIHERAARSGG